MSKRFQVSIYLLVAAFLAACAPAATTDAGRSASPAAPDPSASRTLTIAVRSEASTAAAKPLEQRGTNSTPPSLFNAGLVDKDAKKQTRAELAETLPQLDTDSWKVLPDGRMETTYRLRPGLTRQDGTPLVAEDFAFGLRVYKSPELGWAGQAPQNLIEEIAAPDPRTVTFRWRKPYAGGGALLASEFQALPRHILADPFREMDPGAFAAHPFWSREYIGLGPYKIERWDPGIAVEASAFDGYARGRPKIGKIRVVYIPDANTVVANLLAESVDIATTNSLPFNQGMLVKREWDSRGGVGTILIESTGARATEFQLHPDRVAPGLRGTLDLRARRAMAYTVNKPAINDAVFEGLGSMAESIIEPDEPFFPEVDRTIMKYPFDQRRSEQLMSEAGFTRGPDGIYVSPAGIRFSGKEWIAASAQSELTQAIMLDTWKRAGYDLQPHSLSTVEQRDAQLRAERDALYTGEARTIPNLGSDAIPRPDNRWAGLNRGSWSHPEYDRLLALSRTTLDVNQQNAYIVQMAQIYSDDLPQIPIYYIPQLHAFRKPLVGVVKDVLDIEKWEWKP